MKDLLIKYVSSDSELTAFVFWTGYALVVLLGVFLIIKGVNLLVRDEIEK